VTSKKDAPIDKDAIREQIALAALRHVPFDGWTTLSLEAGARDSGFDAIMVKRVFPLGLSQWAETWSEWADARMVETLGGLDLENMRIRDRIAQAVKARIMAHAGHREALRCCLAWLAIPGNTSVAAKNTLRSVSAMWYVAGDRSADWNYYTKRGLLAPVYTTTVLYWLADTASETDGDTGGEDGDYPDTWGYLDRRIDNVLTIFGLPGRLKERMTKSGVGADCNAIDGGPLGMLKRAFERRMGR